MNAKRASKAANAHHSIWEGLSDIRVLALALVHFGTSAGLYMLGIWTPQIIKSLGLSGSPQSIRLAISEGSRALS